MKKLLRRYFSGVIRFRFVILLLVAGLTVWLGEASTHLVTDYDIEQFFPNWDPARKAYNHYKKIFPEEDAQAFCMIETADIFTPEGIALTEELTRECELLSVVSGRVDGATVECLALVDIEGRATRLTGSPEAFEVLAPDGRLDEERATLLRLTEDVQSLTTARDVVASGSLIQTGPLLPPEDRTAEALKERKKEILSDPLFRDRLVADGGRVSILTVTLPGELNDPEGQNRFRNGLKALTDRHEPESGTLPRFTWSGYPVVRSDFRILIEADQQRLFPFVLFAFVVLMYLAFRRVADVGLALGVVFLAVIWTHGGMALLGLPITMLTMVTVIIITIIGVSDLIHILATYREALREGLDKKSAILDAFETMAGACFMTSFTTFVGFGSLIATNIQMVGDFGLVTGSGVMVAYLLSMTFLPAACAVLPAPGAGEKTSPTLEPPAWAKRLAESVSDVVLQRPRRVVGIGLVVCVMMGGAATLVVRESYIYDDLKRSSWVRQRLEHIESRYGGLIPFNLFVEARPSGTDKTGEELLLRPAVWKKMDRLQRELAGEPEVTNAISPADFIKKANRILHENDPVHAVIPDSRPLLWQILDLIHDREMFQNLMTPDHSAMQVVSRITDCGSRRKIEIIDRIQEEIDRDPIPGVEFLLTGTAVFSQRILRHIVWSLLESFLLAFGTIYLAMLLLIRRPALVTLAMFPNLVPMVAVFGFMGAFGIALKPSTVLVASTALGIAVDDTIHFLSRYRLALNDTGDSKLAIRATIATTGLAIVTTSIILSVGFAALLFSQFLGLTWVGLLVTVAVVGALICDLLLLPALIQLLLGTEPESAR